MFLKNRLFLVLAVFLLASFIAGCSSSQSNTYDMAPVEEMPMEVQTAPEVVRTAYQFAAANPDVLTQLPCYCGCGEMGHTSNYACYIAGKNSDGELIFDHHALGCSICIDITVDAMRMLDEDFSITEIRTFIDQTYSAFGPSNMP